MEERTIKVIEGLVKNLGNAVINAEHKTIKEFGENIKEEQSILWYFMANLKNEIKEINKKLKKIRIILEFIPKEIPGRGRNSQESQIGADAVGILRAKLKDFQTVKGILIQAKKTGKKNHNRKNHKKRTNQS